MLGFDPPDDLPLVERSAVRVVLLDADGRVLLFRTRDAVDVGFGTWWELPGGGLDAGETYREAAVRELREETGFVVAPDAIGPPAWRRRASFRHRHRRHLQDEVVVRVQLAASASEVSVAERLDYELEDYVTHRWWTAREIVASDERFYPGRLPELLTPFLRGETIDEPFELWS